MVEENEVVQEVDPEEISDELETSLPFPNARIVNNVKCNFEKEHQIKKEVKIALNKLLGQILDDISREMDKSEYHTISLDTFNMASRKYREIDFNEKRLMKVKKLLEKQKAELDEVVSEINLEFGLLPTEENALKNNLGLN